jgi:organic radical activating enzyme
VLLAVAKEETPIAETPIPKVEQEASLAPKAEPNNSVRRAEQTATLVGLNQRTGFLWQNLVAQGIRVDYIIDETGCNCGKTATTNTQTGKLTVPCLSAADYDHLYADRKSERVFVADISLQFRYPYAEPFYVLKQAGVVDNVYGIPLEYYECPTAKPLTKWLFPVDMARGVLDFLQFLVTFQCNLSCKGCTNLAELVGQNPKPLSELLYSADEYVSGLEVLSKYFWNISRFRFSGGEPLLHNELPRLVREVRRLFPYTEMAVITNALLLLKDSAKYDDLLTACKEMDCVLAISSYPSVYKRKVEIDAILNKYGVKYYWQGWQVPIEKWRSKRLLHPTGDPQRQWAVAADEQVNGLLHEGYLYASGDSLIMQRIFETFGLDMAQMMEYMETARVRLDKLGDFGGWTEIVKWFKSPNDMHRYWGKDGEGSIGGYAWFDYELIAPSKQKLGDYLMIDTTAEEREMRPLAHREAANA